MSRTIYVSRPEMAHILAAMMPENRLIVRLCMATGLRISDALEIKTAKLKRRMTIREIKTGKSRRVVIPAEGRCDWHKHRARQSVLKDIKKAAAVFQRTGAVRTGCVGTHTARKIAAVEAYQRGGLESAQKLLNHSDPAITLLYALADQQSQPKKGRKRK